MVELQPMETAPLDEMILLDIGLIELVPGHWNEEREKWAFAVNTCCDDCGRDIYFDSEYIGSSDCEGWLPLPRVG